MDRRRRLEGEAFAGAVADGFEQAVQRDELVLCSCPLAWVSLVTPGGLPVRELVVIPDLVSHADDQVLNGHARPRPGRASGGEAGQSRADAVSEQKLTVCFLVCGAGRGQLSDVDGLGDVMSRPRTAWRRLEAERGVVPAGPVSDLAGEIVDDPGAGGQPWRGLQLLGQVCGRRRQKPQRRGGRVPQRPAQQAGQCHHMNLYGLPQAARRGC
jgi:hypothetical protein